MRIGAADQISFSLAKPIDIGILLSFFLILPLFSFSFFTVHQERLVLKVESGKCAFRVEADDESRSLRLRVLPEDSGCYCSKEETQSILRKAFAIISSPKPNSRYSLLFIGRLIDYPWLSEYLASVAYRDRMWDKRRGKPVSMDINRYVSTLLSRREITAHLEEPIAPCGYRITSASVEKVLVGRFRDVPQYKGRMVTGKVPFDAMVWFRLEAR